ncbi:hypothetical protein SAMN05443572_10624 [Myxococcus fulvus]|uniref:Uncharacterized protein n=1 Tax=Myxococcus fulvus TaxID=33 RepID=A0A511TIN4_MYXFU|nr:hypothetical protein [Myxococcus fulvus]GEN13463.1 hypothetical protein MFU01_85000 [Myxococcus fulvus]SEU19531.1 hypothetical protein SAMN05443572_10624 [Myxococcus fulvus]
MTAQLHDTVEYRKHVFELAGVQGTGLFEPSAHGLTPWAMSTACQRGFLCRYRVADKRLMLEELRIGLSAPEEQAVREGRGAPLSGQIPTYSSETHERVVYTRLRAPVAFTGGLLVVDGFNRRAPFHEGLHPAWGRKRAQELLFEGGRLVEERDCDGVMARVHEQAREKSLELELAPHRALVAQWLADAFRRNYAPDLG